MIEFELKFQIPPQRRDAVRAFVSGKAGASRHERLQALYFDTAERSLARAQMALRLRREGSAWVQTLKGVATDGIGRDESEVGLDRNGASEPALDPQRHADEPVGRRLLDLLGDRPGQALRCSFRSDVRRLTRTLRSRHGSVELAFDEGDLQADGERIALCELEIELERGHPLAVIDVARRWALRHGCWLDMRSKAQRGDMLARGIAVAPPRKAARFDLDPQDSALEALRSAIRGCREQILANASQIASGRHDAGHVHQLRVGLRRLRSALELFADDPQAEALAQSIAGPAKRLFGELGALRDRSVLDGPLATSVAQALHEVAPGSGFAALPAQPGDDSPSAVEVVRSPASQHLLLDLIAVGLPPVPQPATAQPRGTAAAVAAAAPPQALSISLRKQLRRRLLKWQRSVARDAGRVGELDTAARHALRKRVKRLRYAAEMASSVLGRKSTRAAVGPLRVAQDRLGELNDVATALQSSAEARERDPQRWFALGWLLARRDALLDAALPAMRKLARSGKRWRKLG